jgi:menaquinone-specific isochorismate synthase
MTQSKISMPVISPENESVIDRLELDNFWHHRPFSFLVTEKTKILSFVQKIPAIDPLAVFQKFAPTNTLRFYWENPSKQEAIAAWGITRDLVIESNARFAKTQSFIKSCFKQVIQEGDLNIGGGETRIFCSFSFFNDTALTNSSHPAATIFLPRFQVTKRNKNYFLVVNIPLEDRQNLKQIKTQLKQKIKDLNWSEYSTFLATQKETINWEAQNLFSPQNSQYFKSTVRSALDSIAMDELSKIVIAHAVDINSDKPFNVIDSLNNLRDRHPDCYIFAIGNNQGQNFIGASPERLVSIQNRQLVTDALAGSAPRGKSNSEDVQWANILLKNRKEKREHQAVSDFILERLQDMGLKPHQLPLQLLQLSNIQHLWTPIYAHLPKGIAPLDIVAQLHPTPAVAGVPNKIVCEKIRHYEKFDRALYAAPLGWIDRRENCEFVVGIRSALIEQNHARLYAGAGIVSGSNPDKEFVEIQLKLQSLLKALV